jgi:glycosyltransferase involved in cell wall biosynthesis
MTGTLQSPFEPVLPLPLPLVPRAVARPTVCVVSPVLNEEATLPRFCDALAAVFEPLGMSWSAIFVSDGSRDGTPQLLRERAMRDARFGFVLLSRNFGHQASISAGLDFADADVIITIDADLQQPPELIPRMLDAWRAGYDVIHARKLDTVGLPPLRAAATNLAWRIVRRVSDVPMIAQGGDFRLLDRRALDAVRKLPEQRRLHRGLVAWIGFNQAVLPYVARAREAGTSQFSVRRLLSVFGQALFDFSSLPLYVGLFLGGVAVVLSAGYLLFIAAWLMFGNSAPPGWASSISVTLLLNSVILAFLGIIGVYVARIYNEVRQRPTYLVSDASVRAPAARGDA